MKKGVRRAHAHITCEAGEAAAVLANQNELGFKLAHNNKAHQSNV